MHERELPPHGPPCLLHLCFAYITTEWLGSPNSALHGERHMEDTQRVIKCNRLGRFYSHRTGKLPDTRIGNQGRDCSGIIEGDLDDLLAAGIDAACGANPWPGQDAWDRQTVARGYGGEQVKIDLRCLAAGMAIPIGARHRCVFPCNLSSAPLRPVNLLQSCGFISSFR
jgi:hypothetical protein